MEYVDIIQAIIDFIMRLIAIFKSTDNTEKTPEETAV